MIVDLEHSPTAQQWQRIGIKHHHGIAVPLSSLHSFTSRGIGEYTDLIPLADWCASVGFDIIQLLPINDTGWGLSPYSALSAFALNPIYLSLDHLPYVDEDTTLLLELNKIPKEASQMVDYANVLENKNFFLRQYFQVFGQKLLQTDDYQNFIESARGWLKGYAVYKILKKRNQERSWEAWEENDISLIESIPIEDKMEFDWYCFLQFLCHTQMKEAMNYALQKNVFIMGDIPILIDRDSADVWQHRDLFDLDLAAGAPPDAFSDTGQNWGFPLYNWPVIESQDYRWWKNRLQWATQYYQIYRIDHIVGFYRIWGIAPGLLSNEGKFIPEEEDTWISHGEKILLAMIHSCNMLPIGEDLGRVPPEVRASLKKLGICGTKVMRWERKWHEDGSYILPLHYPMDSMTTVSTHDTQTLQQWWSKNISESEQYAKERGWDFEPFLSQEHHEEILDSSHHSMSLFHINPLQEYFPLVSGFSWPNPDDERINDPSEISDRNWRYRFRPSIEELANHAELKRIIQEMIK